jgi:hypothetical protein
VTKKEPPVLPRVLEDLHKEVVSVEETGQRDI